MSRSRCRASVALLRVTMLGAALSGVVLPAVVLSSHDALAQAGGAMPALPVTVAKPVTRTVRTTQEFTGRFQASGSVQVTSRVTGTITSAPFTEGGRVKKGDVLFTLDSRTFQAAADQAKAQLQANQTRLDLARDNLKRSQNLSQSGNVTEVTLQTNQQAFLEGQANLESAKAALTSAQLDLDYAQIRAPIAGRVGRKLVTEGNLVVANAATPLTTIVGDDPIDFYFDVDEASFLAYQRANQQTAGEAGGKADRAELREALIALPDEHSFTHKGTLDYLAPQVDTQTGTVTARARLPNPDGALTVGLFGRVRVPTEPPYQGLVVPAAAIGTSAQGHYAVVAGADGAVAIKPVQIGPVFGTFRVVRQGLTPDDQVVVDGLMRARPGGKVVPQTTELKVPEDLMSLLPGPAGQAPAAQAQAPATQAPAAKAPSGQASSGQASSGGSSADKPSGAAPAAKN